VLDAAERRVLVSLAEHDLHDVFRHLYGHGTTAFSWYSNHRGTRVGRRFDHVFASLSLVPVSCEYLHSLRQQGLSDHSAVEVRFAGYAKAPQPAER
jgi:exonuclease III